MAIANLHETILSYTLRKAELEVELTRLQGQKSLALYAQGDLNSALNAQKKDAREFFKVLYDSDYNLQETYKDYTEIPDFEEQIDKITADYQNQLEELTAWETALDAEITTDSAEIEEIKAYLESYKTMLSSNIQEDFNFGLNS